MALLATAVPASQEAAAPAPAVEPVCGLLSHGCTDMLCNAACTDIGVGECGTGAQSSICCCLPKPSMAPTPVPTELSSYPSLA
uniref:Uncharacterized protein n=1 Tax=Setaria italica TaxID=4555 RepID=K3ZKN2_SETIT